MDYEEPAAQPSPDEIRWYNEWVKRYPKLLLCDQERNVVISAVRGDGFCSVWVIMIAYSLLGRDPATFAESEIVIQGTDDPILISDDIRNPRSLAEVKTLVVFIAQELLGRLDRLVHPVTGEKVPSMWFNGICFSRNDLEVLIFEFVRDSETVNSVSGIGHIKVLLLITTTRMELYDSRNKKLTLIGHPDDLPIYITTNHIHYEVHKPPYIELSGNTTDNRWIQEELKGSPFERYPFELRAEGVVNEVAPQPAAEVAPAPPAHADSLGWECLDCTTYNDHGTSTCHVCRAPPPAHADKWMCLNCTVENTAETRACSLCEAPHPLVLYPDVPPPAEVAPQPAAEVAPAPPAHADSLGWECLDCTTYNDHGTSTCHVCRAPPPAHADKWMCLNCTVENTAETRACSLCEAPHPLDLYPDVPPPAEVASWASWAHALFPVW